MVASSEQAVDDTFFGVLAQFGFIRCGASRSYVEFERLFVELSPALKTERMQLEFADLCHGHDASSGSSKLDYQGPGHENGHKLSFQMEYSLASDILWNNLLAGDSFRRLAKAVVDLVRYDLRRSPIQAFNVTPDALRSTVRAILYLPDQRPGIGWHTDPCLAQFISIPAQDSSLRIRTRVQRPASDGEFGSEVEIRANQTAETVLIVGEQASAWYSGLAATEHSVAAVESPRLVFTHFLWLDE